MIQSFLSHSLSLNRFILVTFGIMRSEKKLQENEKKEEGIPHQ
jgi:hypothetical protein